jgi:hypothetical protein
MGTSCLHLLRNFIFSHTNEEEFKVFEQDDDDDDDDDYDDYDDDDAPLHIRNFAQNSLNRYFKASQYTDLTPPDFFWGLIKMQIIESFRM